MKDENNVNSKPLTLIELISIFLKNKGNILISTLIVLVVSVVVYFFVLDLIYLSTATIKSSGKGGGLLGSLNVDVPDLSSLDDIGLSGSKTVKELAAYEEILNSRRCIEALILKFGLKEREEFDFMEDLVKDFRENRLEIKIEKLAGVMYVGVYDKDPVLAKEMVEFLLEELNKINIEMNVLEAKNNREFIEKRYLQAKEDLTKTEDTLKSFQQIYGIAPDLLIKASAQSVFTLEAELKSEEVKLDVVRKILSSDQPEVKLQEEKVKSLKNKISEIQNSTDLNDFLRLGNSPQIAMSFLRMSRDVEIQTKIITFLLPLYEQAKIEEQRETPTVLILDKPYVAERKKKPKRLTMVIIWTFIGFVSAFSYFVFREKYYQFKSRIEIENSVKK
ncbi:MAG: hypothetical protein J0M37_10850 [Ignavibacteria bacterium]|nr:hypothetical protein [Ignavibacteria bacterium]